MRSAYKILVGKPEWKRQLGRPRRRWENNVRMDLREMRWEIVDRIRLMEERDQRWVVVNMVMKFLVA
jgi:hypothetical protein